MTKPEADVDQSNQLKAAVDQVIRENKEAYRREEYKPFYFKSACKVADFTPAQLADTSKLSPAEMSLFLKFRSVSQARMGKAAAAYRSYGGAHGVEEALALERTGSLAEKNTQICMMAQSRGVITVSARRKLSSSFLENLTG